MINKEVFWKRLYGLVIVGIFLCINGVQADSASNSAFNNAYNILYSTFLRARNLVYILSGFGLIGIAVGAIFGKINFRWLAMICIGLAVLAGADRIINYSTSADLQISDSEYMGIGEERFDPVLEWEQYDTY